VRSLNETLPKSGHLIRCKEIKPMLKEGGIDHDPPHFLSIAVVLSRWNCVGCVK
jgi:hypothetical protein